MALALANSLSHICSDLPKQSAVMLSSFSSPARIHVNQATTSSKCGLFNSKFCGEDLLSQRISLNKKNVESHISYSVTSTSKRNSTSYVWRMQVADPLENSLDSFGNECILEKEARQKLESSDSYMEVAYEFRIIKSALVEAICKENYENAFKLKEELETLEFRKRVLELFSKPKTLFRVGDVVRHKKYGYRGVIYGHDPLCSAPDQWKEAMKVNLLLEGAHQPFYHILVDVKDRPEGISTYVAQENLIIQRNAFPITHKWISKFFIDFLDSTYVPKSKLRRVYPHDW